jgi:PAS domain S-box-containing protein
MERKPPPGLFGRLLDGLSDTYVLVLDRDHRIVYANLAFLEHFGLAWEEIAAKACSHLGPLFFSAQSMPTGFCPTDLTTFYPARSILTRERHGEKLFYEVTYFQTAAEESGPWFMGTYRDVTHRFNLESQIRQLDDLERNLVQASMDGIVVNDLLGNVLVFNQGAAKILGYTPEEAIGKLKVSQFYPPGEAHAIKWKIYSSEFTGPGRLENYETNVVRKDGTLVPIWLSARLLHEGDREVGFVGFFRDLRERKKLEEELFRSERLATLGRMLAHISHEIKNPLMTIGGFAGQLGRSPELPAEARRKLEIIHQEVRRLEAFLGDLSTFTRANPPRKVAAELPAVIQEVVELMADGFQEKGIAFELQAPETPAPFCFDPGQLRQVLINLFKNAQEAMPQGGKLLVAVERQQDRVRLTVRDTGQGIAPEHLDALFTPFFSTKEGGTGLGLTISQGLIEQHHGTIAIESEVGRGTTCIIHLPLNDTP